MSHHFIQRFVLFLLIKTTAAAGEIDCMKALLSAGADIDGRDPQDLSTPLIKACQLGQIKAASFLLQTGRNQNCDAIKQNDSELEKTNNKKVSFPLYSPMSELYHAENPIKIEHTVQEIWLF